MSSEANVRSFEILSGGRLSNAQRNEARLFALQIVRDPEFRETLLLQARKGRLPPPVLTMLFHYAYGKPPDRLQIERTGSLEDLTEDQLLERLNAVKGALDGTNPTLEVQGAEVERPHAEGRVNSLLPFSQIK